MSDTSMLATIVTDVARERWNQEERWGENDHTPIAWMSILGKQFGQACQESNAVHFAGKSHLSLRAELVQVAAVAFAAIECLDRKSKEWQSHSTYEAGQ
jgi:hypothetical protein